MKTCFRIFKGHSLNIIEAERYGFNISIDQESFNQLTLEEKRGVLKYKILNLKNRIYERMVSDGAYSDFEITIIEKLEDRINDHPVVIELSQDGFDSFEFDESKTYNFVIKNNGKEYNLMLRKIDDNRIECLDSSNTRLFSIDISEFIEMNFMKQIEAIKHISYMSDPCRTGGFFDDINCKRVIYGIYKLINLKEDRSRIYTFLTSGGNIKSILIRKIGKMITISEDEDRIDWLMGIENFKIITPEEIIDNILNVLYPIYKISITDAKNILSLIINEII